MKKLLFLALSAPVALIFTDVALKFGVVDALHALPCVLTSGAQLSAAPAALVVAALLMKRQSETRRRLNFSPA